MDVDQISTAALRAFAIVGVSAAFVPALARNRVRLAVTFALAMGAVAILWGRP